MRRRCESLYEVLDKLRRLTVVKKLKSKKFSGEIYLVGGAIRDIALEKKPRDFDFAISDGSDISRFEEIFKKRTFVLGKKPLQTHRIYSHPYTIDITILNGSIEEDLKRRDVTINAIAYDIRSDRLIDILGGLRDLKSGIIRFPDENVVVSDPLRMLKAIRHHVSLKDFNLSTELKEAISKHKGSIKRVAGERIKYELDLILASGLAHQGLKTAEELGLLYEIFPEFIHLREFDEKCGLELKILSHTIYGLKFLKRYNRVSALGKQKLVSVGYALLFHDLGKPSTFTFDEEKKVVHFFGHEKVSCEIAKKIMERLRFSQHEMKVVLELIRNHMWIFLLNKETPTNRATRRLILKMGNLTPSLILLTLCDMFGTTEGRRNKTTVRMLRYSREIMNMYREFVKEPLPKIVDGHDLLNIGFTEGPFLGQVLRELREKQLSSEITDKEQALEYARRRLMDS